MKNLWVLILAIVSVSLISSCQKEKQELTDDQLAEEIAFSQSKQVIEPADLPERSTVFVEENNFETYIETAKRVKGRGFEVILGDEEALYFDKRGRHLVTDRGPFSHGPCGRSKPIGIDRLPFSIIDFVAENYPDNVIKRAKKKGDNLFFVKLDSRVILIFDGEGNFLEATVIFFHCRPLGLPLDVENLPELIVSFIDEHFSNPEIKVAFHKSNGSIIVGLFTDEGRKILGFDSEGNLLFERP